MALASSRRQAHNYWPGFVDALAALLMVVVFLVMVFALAQTFLTQALSGRDEALSRLTRQVDELAQMLSLERTANADLRLSVSQLSAQLQSTLSEKEAAATRLAELAASRDAAASERDALLSRLAESERALTSAQLARENIAAETDKLRGELEDAFKVISADKDKIEVQLRDLARLERDIAALQEVRKTLEAQIAPLAEAQKRAEAETGRLRDTNRDLEAKLADQRERTNLAQTQIESLSAKAEDQVRLLNQQIAAMRSQLAALQEALQASEAKNREQNVQITNLGSRLNEALASRVQELARYRSEFFGRLREVLGDRQDLRIVGDRFVFQSEVLFASGEADIGEAGKVELAKLGAALAEISQRIPKDIDWVLRVDGHTDVRPISTARFPSNWELSTARAVSVVKFLIDHGVPPGRLVAAGFGEYRPIESGGTEEALRRNRRIEFKLDQR